MLAMDKHSSVLQKFVNYGRKSLATVANVIKLLKGVIYKLPMFLIS
jgi:hypothetical protein